MGNASPDRKPANDLRAFPRFPPTHNGGVPDRIVKPEILDHLPSDDPAALRSRRDLRRINWLMGNESWILKTVRQFPEAAAKGICELGAGDGALSEKLAQEFPPARVTAYDLAPRPEHLDARVHWSRGDIFETSGDLRGGILVANLFLHHFEGAPLEQLGKLCEGFEVIVFNEPSRDSVSHFFGHLLDPFVNHVTRHDMHVSIDAGFLPGDLPSLMGLTGEHWRIQEDCTWRGAVRMLGCRV
jgi:hypothetical protein